MHIQFEHIEITTWMWNELVNPWIVLVKTQPKTIFVFFWNLFGLQLIWDIDWCMYFLCIHMNLYPHIMSLCTYSIHFCMCSTCILYFIYISNSISISISVFCIYISYPRVPNPNCSTTKIVCLVANSDPKTS